MTERTGPPPEDETAALVGKPGQRRDFDISSGEQNTTSGPATEALPTLNRKRLFEIADAVSPRGELRRYVPKWPRWCRRAGADVILSFIDKGWPDETEIRLLLDAYSRAVAKRNEASALAEKHRALQALADRIASGERIPPGALTAILGPVK